MRMWGAAPVVVCRRRCFGLLLTRLLILALLMHLVSYVSAVVRRTGNGDRGKAKACP